MKLLFYKGLHSLQERGPIKTVQAFFFWLLRTMGMEYIPKPFRLSKQLEIRIIPDLLQLSDHIDQLFQSTVQAGPFKGLRLPKHMAWGSFSRGAMLLGLYEQEVQASLQALSKHYSTLIDIGGADGYYAVGSVANHLFERSICYEASPLGRETIKETAALNKALDRVDIRGIARKGFYQAIPQHILEKAVCLIDIEGGEFDILDPAAFKALSKSVLIIEIHDFMVVNGAQKLEKLKSDALATHTLTELTMGARDLSPFAELKPLPDTIRWLICSEGRSQLMHWLRLDPKIQA